MVTLGAKPRDGAPASPKGPMSRPSVRLYSPSFPQFSAVTDTSEAATRTDFTAGSSIAAENGAPGIAVHELKAEPGNRAIAARFHSTISAHTGNSSPVSRQPTGDKESTLDSLLLAEGIGMESIASVARADAYLREALEVLNSAVIGLSSANEEGSGHLISVAPVRASLRGALREIAEPKSGLVITVLSLEACAKDSGDHVSKFLKAAAAETGKPLAGALGEMQGLIALAMPGIERLRSAVASYFVREASAPCSDSNGNREGM